LAGTPAKDGTQISADVVPCVEFKKQHNSNNNKKIMSLESHLHFL
jgi:hypothetical protein